MHNSRLNSGVSAIILNPAGEPLRDGDGDLIMLRTERGAEMWLKPPETVRPATRKDRRWGKPAAPYAINHAERR